MNIIAMNKISGKLKVWVLNRPRSYTYHLIKEKCKMKKITLIFIETLLLGQVFGQTDSNENNANGIKRKV